MTTDLSRNDQRRGAVLAQMNQLAWLLDNSIYLPILNYRIGLEAIIGLIPGVGDVAGMLLSSFIVFQAIRLGAPKATLLRMVLNVVLETLIGLIPLLGDLFDATFKANARNVRLLSEALENQQPGRTRSTSAGIGVIAAVIGVLVGMIVLIGGAGIVLFWQ